MPVALLSVYDKTGVVDLARGLTDAGWEIWSSGGTATFLAEAGLDVTDVAQITGFPPMLGHRVATLHPLIHGGILGDRGEIEHVREMEQYGIRPISLVVVNLYPFASNPSIELIDVGGPALVRGAAKNHAHVAVVVRPEDYGLVLDDIRTNGEVGQVTRRRLARTAFHTTARLDAQIADWLGSNDEVDAELPFDLSLDIERAQSLRYGENPHQIGARYRIAGRSSWWDDAVQHGGKELSYLNVFDADAAWSLVNQFSDPACVIVKHANPCGVAVVPGGSIAEAYRRANDCDPVSAFGGIVAVNRPVTREMASALVNVFTEVVIAPEFDVDALTVLLDKPNLRILSGPLPYGRGLDVRSIDGGLLVQSPDVVRVDPSAWRVVTTARPNEDHWADIAVAWHVVAAVSSNAIVLVRDGRAVGIGAGQQNRLDSARIAVERADGRAFGGVCASDAFFPFRDGLDAVARAGVAVVVQPGGSVRDEEVIAAANELGVAMVFTGRRHFRH
ncbi:MAG: bifunctional phosphoribosylaminoimidazolecarboxamide formyltransferase/IMP cyclohydrolase [Actinomycetota bacterium]